MSAKPAAVVLGLGAIGGLVFLATRKASATPSGSTLPPTTITPGGPAIPDNGPPEIASGDSLHITYQLPSGLSNADATAAIKNSVSQWGIMTGNPSIVGDQASVTATATVYLQDGIPNINTSAGIIGLVGIDHLN